MSDLTGNILIVDDEEDTALLLRDSLRKRGFDVDSVTSGQAALEHLRTTPADVVVTDVQMAGMTGIELCRSCVRGIRTCSRIVLTGQGGLETAIAAIRAGAYDFITKPVEDRRARDRGRAARSSTAAAPRGQAPARARRRERRSTASSAS